MKKFNSQQEARDFLAVRNFTPTDRDDVWRNGRDRIEVREVDVVSGHKDCGQVWILIQHSPVCAVRYMFAYA